NVKHHYTSYHNGCTSMFVIFKGIMMYQLTFKVYRTFQYSWSFYLNTWSLCNSCIIKLINIGRKGGRACIYSFNQFFDSHINYKLFCSEDIIKSIFIRVSGPYGRKHYMRRIFAHNIKKGKRSKIWYSVFTYCGYP